MTPTIYITVPVEVKPEKADWYAIERDDKLVFKVFFGHGQWCLWPFGPPLEYEPICWYKPATRADLINLLREDLEKAMGEVWENAVRHTFAEEYGRVPNPNPDRSTSINNAIQKLIG